MGYSAWGRKEFDKTEHARMHPYLNHEKTEIRNQAYFSLYRNSRLGGLMCSHSGTYASILYMSQSLWPQSPLTSVKLEEERGNVEFLTHLQD